ncbi:Gfo/Idh/MocA family protein [Microlunatus speluncae]|uniref:Gfo/Idh/MocA family protein n=1 Tax=Microlunatus speluncae TaxID=2594267 RepID=UPI0012667692|nr:Gfo/Idh/MocA family oxidoreductase [Microlunatus speluncae]
MTATSPTSTSDRPLRAAIIGFGWMGQVHARAYRRLGHHYPELVPPELVAVAEVAGGDRLRTLCAGYGVEEVVDDWADLLGRDDLDLVSVTTPNFLHAEIGTAVAAAGHHLWLEKPAGRDLAETTAISSAVTTAGVRSAVGFNYRNAPAVELARQLITDGRLGRVTMVSIRMLADYAAHPDGAFSWRFDRSLAGSGVLGDLVCHGVDLGRYVVGEIESVIADDAIFIAERPEAGAATSHFARGSGPVRSVQNEDYLAALLRFAGGARGVLESCRSAVGDQCRYGIEVRGTEGALAWDFRRMGELQLCVDGDYADAAYRTVLVGAGAGDSAAFQPAAGIALGYDDLKVIELHRLITAIHSGAETGATMIDAVAAARIGAALQRSIAERRWVDLD